MDSGSQSLARWWQSRAGLVRVSSSNVGTVTLVGGPWHGRKLAITMKIGQTLTVWEATRLHAYDITSDTIRSAQLKRHMYVRTCYGRMTYKGLAPT